MTTLRVPFEMEIDVQFENPNLATSYFTNGSDWSNVFGIFENLNEVAKDLANDFFHTKERRNHKFNAWTRFVEGYGLFVNDGNDVYSLSEEYSDDCGNITISFEIQLEAMNASKIGG